MKKNVVIGISGASGMIYAHQLIEKLKKSEDIGRLAIVFSLNAQQIWQAEIKSTIPSTNERFVIYDNNDFSAPFASGSSQFSSMVIIPSSMGMLGRIANGISDDLMTRCADVMLKEKRKLILVIREAPYNLIHIENMKKVTLAGAIVCPANPSFYNNPQTIAEIANTVVDRIIDLLEIPNPTFRWGDCQ